MLIQYFYFLLIFLPFFAFFLINFYGNFLGRFGCIFISTFSIFLSFLFVIILFINFYFSYDIFFFSYGNWFSIDFLIIKWSLLYDSITFIMLFVVLIISFLVHLYSIEYMFLDPHLSRFMSYLSLFTCFMLILITAGNFLQMFIGWEGVGLCSFLLINFWFTRPEANAASLRAIIINRIGDLFMIFAFILIYTLTKSLDYQIIFNLASNLSNLYYNFLGFHFYHLSFICFFLFLGALAKSAQIPFHSWLPRAMEGPTPVSALIHAATMVTAGVFLIIRCSPLFEALINNFIHTLILFIGSFSAIFGSIVGLTQMDLKKVYCPFSTTRSIRLYVFNLMVYLNILQLIFHLTTHIYI